MGVGQRTMMGKEVAGFEFGWELLGSCGDCGETLVENTDSFVKEFVV